MSEFFKRLFIATIAIGAVALLPGCAGTVKKTAADGSITKTPASVAVIQASAASHEACGAEQSFQLNVEELSQLSASAQAEAMRNVPMMALMGYIQSKEGMGCHAQVSSETKAYFLAQQEKYRQFGNAGQTIGRWVGGYFIVDAVMGGVNAPAGDTTIGEVNVSGSTAGSAGEGTMNGGSVNQTVQVGGGALNEARDGGVNVLGEKPLIGDGNSMDDSGDGSNNNPGFFN